MMYYIWEYNIIIKSNVHNTCTKYFSVENDICDGQSTIDGE